MNTEDGITVLLLGKTGIGKSTTGNKLLGVDDSEQSYEIYEYNSFEVKLNQSKDEVKFKVGDNRSLVTTTKECKLLANHSLKIKVLDVSGFSPTSQYSVFASNVSIFRDVLLAQYYYGLIFNCIMYFFPVRRFPEKGDGLLQQEISLMYRYFGVEIFNCMIIVLTKSPFDDHDEELNITKELKCHTENVFMAAVKSVTGVNVSCPPIIYISLKHSGDQIRKRIISEYKADLSKGIKLKVSNNICIKCGAKSQSACTSNKQFTFIKQSFNEKQEGNKDQKLEDEKCHPDYVLNANFRKAAFGELLNFFTVGISRRLFGVPTLDDITETCINCHKPRGSPGCLPIHYRYTRYDGNIVVVNHENFSQELASYAKATS